jgi:hypothetical protein
LALGFHSVKECQEAISSTEFAEWQAYDLIEPFGTDRFPMFFGTIAATIANTQLTKNSKAKQWYDFFPPYGGVKHQTVDEQIAVVEMLNSAFGGLDLRGNKNTLSA